MNIDRAANGNRSLVRSSHCLISKVQSLEVSAEDIEEQPSIVKEIVKLRRMYAMDFMMQIMFCGECGKLREAAFTTHHGLENARSMSITPTDHPLFYNHPYINVWETILGASPSMPDASISVQREWQSMHIRYQSMQQSIGINTKGYGGRY
ncbi:MAG: hypothetical protein U0176_19280 [Bacteroidia bacterium]